MEADLVEADFALRGAEAGFAFALADVLALLEPLPLRFCAMRHSSSG